MTPRPPHLPFDTPQRAPLLALVLLLHLAVLWWWAQSPRPGSAQRERPTAGEVGRIVLRLFAEPPRIDMRDAEPAATPARSAPATAAPARDTVGVPTRSQAITSPPQAAEPPAEAKSPEPDATPPAALDLRLPRAASAAPSPAQRAIGDVRSNTPRKGFGDRLADVLSNDTRIVEERMQGEGAMRVRQGADCVEVHQARSVQLDPFNGSARPTPSAVKSCD